MWGNRWPEKQKAELSRFVCEDLSDHTLENSDHKALAGFTSTGVGHKVLQVNKSSLLLAHAHMAIEGGKMQEGVSLLQVLCSVSEVWQKDVYS